MKQTLHLRLVVTEPLSGVWCAMQRGKSDLLAPTSSTNALTFDFPVLVDLSTDPPRLTGEYTQGPPAKRFVYINTGTYAGQSGTSWSRRAKVPITGIPVSLIREALAGGNKLEARVRGTGRDGGPFCASVPLLSEWAIAGAA